MVLIVILYYEDQSKNRKCTKHTPTKLYIYIYIHIFQNFSSCSLAASPPNPTGGSRHTPFFSPLFSVFFFSFPSSPFYGLLCRRSLRDKRVKERQTKKGGGGEENRRPSLFCLLSRTHAPRPRFTRHLQFASPWGTDPVTAFYKDARAHTHTPLFLPFGALGSVVFLSVCSGVWMEKKEGEADRRRTSEFSGKWGSADPPWET